MTCCLCRQDCQPYRYVRPSDVDWQLWDMECEEIEECPVHGSETEDD